MREGWEHKALAFDPDMEVEFDWGRAKDAISLVRDAIAQVKVSGQSVTSVDDYVPVKQRCFNPEESLPYIKMVIRDVNRRSGAVDIFLWEIREDGIVFVIAKKYG